MSKPKVGFLSLYLELYDNSWSFMRKRVDEFHKIIIRQLEKRNLEVTAAPVCRIHPEFVDAIAYFEREKVDAIVTVHLSYSPSLECIDVLAETTLPLIVLDITPTYEFSPEQSSEEILYNHGIHGVQDLCNLLIRRNKAFFLEAGHWEESDVLDRAAKCARAANLVVKMRSARVGRIGESFKGMGDFAVPVGEMKSTIGIETVLYDFNQSKSILEEVCECEIKLEMESDYSNFLCGGINEEIHRRTVMAGLIVRRWIEKEKLTAFTINFLAINKVSGLPCVPFIEACKAMARGIGYAGEGDVLTAALVGALVSVYPETTFTEMFCPDWKNNSIFLSHMGEMNINLAANKPRMVEYDFVFTDVDNPAVAYARLKGGRAVLVDLAPVDKGKYSLIIAPVEMLEVIGEDRMKESIHGWFRPSIPISDFLAEYSRAGGTHHAVLVYGQVEEEIDIFGKMMGWKVSRIG